MLIGLRGKYAGRAVFQSLGIPKILPKMAWTAHKPNGKTTVRRNLKTSLPVRRSGEVPESPVDKTFRMIIWGTRTKYQAQNMGMSTAGVKRTGIRTVNNVLP
jgi:hypothetical protein